MTNLQKLLALSLVAATTACAGDDAARVTTDPGAAPAATTELTPTATFASSTGSTIEIYAIGEHGYFATELAAAGVARVLDGANEVARETTSNLYRALTGRTDVPASLVALDRQLLPVAQELVAARDRRATRGTVSVPETPTTIASAGNCTATYFQAHDCPQAFGGNGIGARDFCLLDWGGGAYEYASTVDISDGYLCSSKGQILWQISNGDGGFHQWSVLEGQFFNYYLHDPGETWLHYDVLQATGDTFQFGGDFYWY